jgi:hypothetical protein
VALSIDKHVGIQPRNVRLSTCSSLYSSILNEQTERVHQGDGTTSKTDVATAAATAAAAATLCFAASI